MSAAQYAREALERAEKATGPLWALQMVERGNWLVATPDSYETGDYPVAEVREYGDAEFIVSARSDVPKLARAVIAVAEQADALDEMAETPIGIGEVGSALRLAARSIRHALSDALEVKA